MATTFLICACVGGTLLVCQFLASLVGLGGDHGDVGGHDLALDHDVDHDVGHDHDADHGSDGAAWYVSMLSLRTVTAALTFFGLAGMAGLSGGMEPGLALLVALAAGGGAFGIVHQLLRGLRRLRSDGTVRIERSVGKVGTVYLRVPGNRTGRGKVQLELQNRIVEYQALTAAAAMPAGSRAVVVAVVGPDTVEVAPAPIPEATAHV